jgi:hypothetical protein
VVDEARDVAEALGVDRVSVVVQIVQIKNVLLRVIHPRRPRLHGKYMQITAMAGYCCQSNRMYARRAIIAYPPISTPCPRPR